MARLAAAFGSSHSVMLSAELEDWQTRFREADLRLPFYDIQGNPWTYAEVLAHAPQNAAERVTPEAIAARYREAQEAMRHLAGEIADSKLDALIVLGDDQHELFHDTHMPAIGIYYGDSIRNGVRRELPPEEWYRRAQMRRLEEKEPVHYPCHGALARHLIGGLRDREFDIASVCALSESQHEGHAYSFIHRWYLKHTRLPIVPVFLNTYYPPNQPLPRRCVRLGQALRELVAAFPGEERIGLIASGGLSHFRVEEDLDRGVLAACRDRDLDFLAALPPARLQAGSSEIRNWIAVAAAAVDLKMSWVSYTPGYRTPALTGTGLGFAAWR